MKTAWEQGWNEATVEQRVSSRRWKPVKVKPGKKPPFGCRLTGDTNQCGGCGDWFASSSAFDKHRVGKFGANRRCMTIPEMEAAGFARNDFYFWMGGKMKDRSFLGSISSPS